MREGYHIGHSNMQVDIEEGFLLNNGRRTHVSDIEETYSIHIECPGTPSCCKRYEQWWLVILSRFAQKDKPLRSRTRMCTPVERLHFPFCVWVSELEFHMRCGGRFFRVEMACGVYIELIGEIKRKEIEIKDK